MYPSTSVHHTVSLFAEIIELACEIGSTELDVDVVLTLDEVLVIEGDTVELLGLKVGVRVEDVFEDVFA